MTPELLELIKQAQPYLPNEWKVGDRYYCPRQAENGNDGVKYIECTYIQEYRVEPCCPDIALHYPYPHQIWKMIDWNVWKIYVFKNGEVEISHRNLSREIRIRDTDPEPALLKAFIWQKEREEKEK